MRVRLADAAERAGLFDFGADVRRGGRRSVHEFMARAEGVSFPAPGVYRLQAFAHGEMLTERHVFMHRGGWRALPRRAEAGGLARASMAPGRRTSGAGRLYSPACFLYAGAASPY